MSEYRVRVVQDTVGMSPDEWGNDEVFLVNYHRDFDVRRDEIVTKEQVKAFYRGEEHGIEGYYIFKLTMLSHSGVWLSLDSSFSCDSGGWDTSHVGLVLVSEKEAEGKEEALKCALGLVKTWNMCLSGDIWGYIVEEKDECKECGNVEWEEVDSCWGIYGADEVEKAVPEEYRKLIPEQDAWV